MIAVKYLVFEGRSIVGEELMPNNYSPQKLPQGKSPRYPIYLLVDVI